MFEIIGSVERVVFINEKNGYSVIEIASEDGSITATGTMPGISVGEELKTNNFSVIYFGGAGSEREFKFKFSLEIISQSGAVTTFSSNYAGSIVRDDFDSNGQCSISSDCMWHGENLGTFEFSFSKLTKDTF